MTEWVRSETNSMDSHSKLRTAPVKPKGKSNTRWQKKAEGLTNNHVDRGRAWQPQLLTTAEAEFEDFVRTSSGVQLEDL